MRLYAYTSRPWRVRFARVTRQAAIQVGPFLFLITWR